ncbi:hypothetical protein IFM89_017092 [Coptis chinensis]|uniref:Uncharacterized protein n=1 Tax=Coptis chinensis TaxID=261450 RepID=A0A835LIY5_9MAGN|nr:hypothetical protein IFM89_017092 [Coptis chinensis]
MTPPKPTKCDQYLSTFLVGVLIFGYSPTEAKRNVYLVKRELFFLPSRKGISHTTPDKNHTDCICGGNCPTRIQNNSNINGSSIKFQTFLTYFTTTELSNHGWRVLNTMLGDKDAINKERARLTDEMNRGYFADIAELKKHGGKISMANKTIVPAMVAVKFPPLEVNFSDGTSLKLPISTSQDKEVEDRKVVVSGATLLCLSFRANSQLLFFKKNEKTLPKTISVPEDMNLCFIGLFTPGIRFGGYADGTLGIKVLTLPRRPTLPVEYETVTRVNICSNGALMNVEQWSKEVLSTSTVANTD